MSRRWRLAAWLGALLFVLSLAAGFLTTTVTGANLLLDALEASAPHGPDSPLPPGAQAIVVLTGRMERTDKAAALAKATRLPAYVAGDARGDMATHLQKRLGVTPQWVDRQSFNTESNAAFAACTLHAQGIRSIALVTDTRHMLRARLWFRYYGFEVVANPMQLPRPPVPTDLTAGLLPSRTGRAWAKPALHEIGGLATFAGAWVTRRRLDVCR